MKNHLLSLALATSLVAPLLAQTPTTPYVKESVEWCDIWITHANETKLPRILLVGDSITKGYAGEVEKQLEGKAYLSRLCTSSFDTDPALTSTLSIVLQTYNFEVIHFNNGMHGWGHSEEEYEQGLQSLLATLRKYAPNAKLIWANTTPINDSASKPGTNTVEPTEASKADSGKLMLQVDLKAKSNARVDARNDIASKLMRSENIPIDDLHSLVLGHPELYHGDVHFNGSGTSLQAAQVVSTIQKALSK